MSEKGVPVTAPNNLPWTLAGIELDFLFEMKKTALKLGVQFVDRVGVVDLLTDGEQISGCVGYHIEDGTEYIFQAKAVVLACGGQNYRIMPMWAPGRGEGLAAAWRAGAKFSNTEYGSFCNWLNLDNYEAVMGVEEALYNDKGENVGLQHRQGEMPYIDVHTLSEWYKQMRAGNGPMHYHADENILMPSIGPMLASDAIYDRPFSDKFWNYLFFNAGTNHTNDTIVPGLIGEFTALWVDKDFQTSIKGLFSAGDTCYTGSGVAGAVPAPPARTRGGGLGFALYSGIEVGESVAAYAPKAVQGKIDGGQISESHSAMFTPLSRSGEIHPNMLLEEIQAVVGNMGNSVCRSEARMQKAIDDLELIAYKLDRLTAKDTHELFLCNEVKSMVLCALGCFSKPRSSARNREGGFTVRITRTATMKTG